VVGIGVLDVNDDIKIPLSEIDISAVRSQGAGGQNVNKVSTAIHLRFDVRSSSAIPEPVRQRLLATRDHRITADGVVVIKSQQTRSQEKNRLIALERLAELIRSATITKKNRKPTRPGKRAKAKRMDDKTRRGRLKESRGKIID